MEPSRRTEAPLDKELNNEALREELNLVDEIPLGSALHEATVKQQIALRHDSRVKKREFQLGSLVLWRNQKDSREGKLVANWERPYRVHGATGTGSYYLEHLNGEPLPRPWNAMKLKQYYS